MAPGVLRAQTGSIYAGQSYQTWCSTSRFLLAAKKYPVSVTTSQRSPITAALLQRRTLIGYLDLCFTVADPKRDFRACSYLCVGLLDRLLLNDTPISNTDLEFVGLFTFFARI